VLGVEGWSGFAYYGVAQAAVREGSEREGRGGRSFFHVRVFVRPRPSPPLPPQAAAVLYAKAGGAPADYAPSALSLLAGEAAGSTALLTFVLFWTLAHNWVHLF